MNGLFQKRCGDDFGGEGVAAEVRVVRLAEEVGLGRAFGDLRLPGGEDIGEDEVVFFREAADEIGALAERVLWIG